jgi:2-dehydro-3-deoxygluconokinase
MSRLLCLGECMLELSSPSDNAWHLGVAGDTLNTAWYARRCLPETNWTVAYGTRIGVDLFSERVHRFLSEARIETDWVQRDPQRTVGLYAISLENGERHFTYWRGQSAARHLADDSAALDAALHAANVVYYSGITLAILAPEARAKLLQALAAARSRGCRVAFDPNHRPRLWDHTDTMAQETLKAAAIADWVLPSFDDERRFFGDDSLQACAQRYLAAGAREVVVKNAGDAMVVADAAHQQVIDVGQPQAPVDSTAAGDAFNAAYLGARLADQPATEAARAGHALASRVIGAHGALVALDA